jgi:hypothetical protein
MNADFNLLVLVKIKIIGYCKYFLLGLFLDEVQQRPEIE